MTAHLVLTAKKRAERSTSFTSSAGCQMGDIYGDNSTKLALRKQELTLPFMIVPFVADQSLF